MRRLAILFAIVGYALVVSIGAAIVQAQSTSLKMRADSNRVVLGDRSPSTPRRPTPCHPPTHRPGVIGSLGTSCQQTWSSSRLSLARDPVPLTAGRNWAYRTIPQTDMTQTLSNATWEASHPEAQPR